MPEVVEMMFVYAAIIFMIILFIISLVVAFKWDYDSCYAEQKKNGYISRNDLCCGMYDGSKDIEYLSDCCLECPYLSWSVYGVSKLAKKESHKKHSL